MGELIALRPGTAYDGLLCACGSAWFATRITVGRDGRPTGYALPLVCGECGAEIRRA